MVIYDCNHDCAHAYLVIWSLRISTQDWVAKACAPVPEANKSLVGASSHFASYTSVSMRTAHDREGNNHVFTNWCWQLQSFSVDKAQPAHTHIFVFTTLLPSFSICSSHREYNSCRIWASQSRRPPYVADVEGSARIQGEAASIHESYMDGHGDKVAEEGKV